MSIVKLIPMALLMCTVSAFAQQAPASENAQIRAAEAWAIPQEQSPDPSAPHAKVPKSNPNSVIHVPGSTRSYTLAQTESYFLAQDWFPQDHPPLPHVVEYGRKPLMACGVCHQANGRGDPASASLAGLPKAYIVEQLQAFRDEQRDKNGVMPFEARNLGAADEQAVVAYFSKLKFTPRVRVVETTSVPKTHWEEFVLVPDKDGAREPIGERIIEIPVNFALYDVDDARTGFIAYVPPGSVQRGAVIAAKGSGTAASCQSCHGARLQGVGNIPYLAGRSPTYIARELILFREGKRTNPGAAPMRQEVSHLTLKDMIDVAAYAASLKP